MRKFLESPVNDMVDKNVRNYIAKLEKENRSMNWKFWVLVVLILISDFVIYCWYDYLVSDVELMWQDIITVANDTYNLSQIHNQSCNESDKNS